MGVGAAVVGGAVVGVGVGLMVGLVVGVVGAAVGAVDVGVLVVLRGLGGDPAELRLDVGGTGAPAEVVETGARHDTV